MKNLHSSRNLIKIWHRGEKATIDHLVRALREKKNKTAGNHSAFTASGLSIEDQVRKAWGPPTIGLAMF